MAGPTSLDAAGWWDPSDTSNPTTTGSSPGSLTARQRPTAAHNRRSALRMIWPPGVAIPTTSRLSDRTQIEQTKPMNFFRFLSFVYETYPVVRSPKYSTLDLVGLADEYRSERARKAHLEQA
jgi:hypothetical protein